MAQQMPLPLTISCSSKSRLVLPSWCLPFWCLLTRVVPDKFQKSSKTVVCVLQTGHMTQTHNRFTALWTLSRTMRWAGIRRNIHPLTPIVVINRPLSASATITIHGIHPAQCTCLTVFQTASLQVFFGLLLGLAPQLHTIYISSPNHCLLFAAHAYTIATCFAVVQRLCYVI